MNRSDGPQIAQMSTDFFSCLNVAGLDFYLCKSVKSVAEVLPRAVMA